MSGHRYTATVRWNRDGATFTDRRYSRAHAWSFDGGTEVRASASPLIVRAPFSDAQAVDPEEAFVASVASCHMLFFLDYAAQAGYVVDSYEDASTATMGTNDEGRQFVESIVLAPRTGFSGAKIPSAAEIDALHERAHHDCFIANSVKTAISVTRERDLSVGSDRRRFLLTVPGDAHGPLPLVVELHGSGHFAAGQMAASNFAALGAREQFAVAAPEAAIPLRLRPEWPEGRAWNVPGVPLTSGELPDDGPDDVAFLEALIATLVAEGVADERRIYFAGFSGGARMCSHVAGVWPERIAAIGSVAGLRLPPRAATAPPPIIALHSRADEVNPYPGGGGPRWDGGVDETERAYAERYAWSGPETDVAGDALRRRYRDASGSERLVTYTLNDRPHGWYGSRDPQHMRQHGTAGDTIDASALLWDFFRDKSRMMP